MANTIRLEIVTPEARTFSEDVEMAVLPGVAGEMGVLPGHEALMTAINAGELRVTRQGKEILLAVGPGFAEVTGQSIRVLTDMAIESDSIDEAAAEEARRRAEQALKQKMTDEEHAAVEASLQKAMAQLSVKRRRREAGR